jgi:cell division protein FtsL
MLGKINYMENLTDRIAVIIGGASGVIFANLNYIQDILVKLLCTVVFAAVGAIVAFFMKRYLENKFKNK